MPEGTRVHNCVDEVKKRGGAVNAYAVCQAATGQSFATGKPTKKKKKKSAKVLDLLRNKPALTGECKSLFTPRFKDWLSGKGHWVTMGSHGSPPHGGVHVELDEEGDIEKGPAGTEGEKPSEVGKKPGKPQGKPDTQKQPATQAKPEKTPAEKLKPGAAEAGKPAPQKTPPVEPPPDQPQTLKKISREAQDRDFNDSMRELSGVNLADNAADLPKKVADQFDAHGTATLDSLAKLLNGGIDPEREFYSSPLSQANARGSAGGVVVRDNSSFVVLGHPGKTLKDGGIAGVMVDPLHAPSIPDLQKAFPGIKFFSVKDAGKVLPKVAGNTRGGINYQGGKPATPAEKLKPAAAQAAKPTQTKPAAKPEPAGKPEHDEAWGRRIAQSNEQLRKIRGGKPEPGPSPSARSDVARVAQKYPQAIPVEQRVDIPYAQATPVAQRVPEGMEGFADAVRAAKKPVAEAKPVHAPVAKPANAPVAQVTNPPTAKPANAPVAEHVPTAELDESPRAQVREAHERGPHESEDDYFDRITPKRPQGRNESDSAYEDRQARHIERQARKLPKVRRAPKEKSLFTPQFLTYLERVQRG